MKNSNEWIESRRIYFSYLVWSTFILTMNNVVENVQEVPAESGIPTDFP